MDIATVIQLLESALSEKGRLPNVIADIQDVVWNDKVQVNDATEEILRDLAYDLDHYEPSARARAESSSFLDEAQAMDAIKSALTRIAKIDR